MWPSPPASPTPPAGSCQLWAEHGHTEKYFPKESEEGRKVWGRSRGKDCVERRTRVQMCAGRETHEQFPAFDHFKAVYRAEWLQAGRFLQRHMQLLVGHITQRSSLTLWAGLLFALLLKILYGRLNYHWRVSSGMSERPTGWPHHSWCQLLVLNEFNKEGYLQRLISHFWDHS